VKALEDENGALRYEIESLKGRNEKISRSVKELSNMLALKEKTL